MSRRSVKQSVLAVLAASALLLSACVPGSPPSRTSTPTGESVSPELEPFYSQVLEWEDCGDGMQCTTATAPLDWDDPAAGEAELALVRHSATGDRIGSLLVNPGGPGGSGYDFVASSLDFAVGKPLQERFDVVGFDPRGVGRSSAVSCVDPAQMDEYLYGIPEAPRGSDAWIEEIRAGNAEFGAACEARTGELLANVDTVSAARDLDLLRAVLGDEKLNYLGYSYGTFLGATFAESYPEHVGRLVLDGALDPTSSESDVTRAQAVGFEHALRAYLEDCLTGEECPFTGSADEAMAEISELLASVDQSPLRGTDGRQVDADALITAIIFPLYSPDRWPYLTQLFTSVQFGDADLALQLADAYNGRNPDGTYLDNSTEAFAAINCLDYEYQSDVSVMREKAAEVAAAAPVIGPYFGYGDLGCIDWPAQSTADRAPIHAEGADPILVIGTTGDPATPYEWSVALADQLDSGVLVTYEGEGHTAYNKSNQCVSDAVERYLIDGTVPDNGLTC
ncbi:alpha/beta hydrolase [Agromyces aerolatus]|uniref:alpha/beta hydrolase n=1 Tax=Agromyces sp. LY-1074 TaxID=3074080 RepID=UPI0028653A09|nr:MULTISPECIES: alpha/beta hydrolase [unclassified Agromyces]MDR5700269.1 alpha/beta hydrolase [Agromyces sp. LY-1074]MDR5706753.1 alpha/beta hydrolase [Agromyces sp. LY-1358]